MINSNATKLYIKHEIWNTFVKGKGLEIVKPNQNESISKTELLEHISCKSDNKQENYSQLKI